MGRARPWLLVGGVILLAALVAYFASLEPPEDRTIERTHIVMGNRTTPMTFTAMGTMEVQESGFPSTDRNVTRISMRATALIENAAGHGTLTFVVRAKLGELTNETEPILLYSCESEIPFPVLEENDCPPTDLRVEFPIFDDWRVAPDPRPDEKGLRGPPTLGHWSFEYGNRINGGADFTLMQVEMELVTETFYRERTSAY